MLRVIHRLLNTSRHLALALVLGVCSSAWAADMSTPARPFPLGRRLTTQPYSSTQSYGQAAYAPHVARPSSTSPMAAAGQHYNQQKYLPKSASDSSAAAVPTAPATAITLPMVPRVDPRFARSPSPYSFAGTPLAPSRPATPPTSASPAAGSVAPATYTFAPIAVRAATSPNYSPAGSYSGPQPTPARRPRESLSSLAAFNQDLVPLEEPSPPTADEEPSLLQDDSANAPEGPPAITGETPADQVFGVAPESNTMQFLRAQSVLLEPGERQIDVGMEYAISEGRPLDGYIFGAPPEPEFYNSRSRNRLLLIPLEIRYGLMEDVQLFCSMPFGWANSEILDPSPVSPDFGDSYSNKVGIGDTNFGASILLCDGGGNAPDVVASLAVTAPTGQAELSQALFASPFSQLGEGYWAGSASVLCIQNYDPVVVFYGLGYRHRFDATFDGGFTLDPGEQIIYQFGVGFAANETVTLSCNFVGLYVTDLYVNDVRLQGSIQEPMQLRFAITCAQECKIVEPFAAIGMTNDAPNARIGITWTF